jgi:hypothetical protein
MTHRERGELPSRRAPVTETLPARSRSPTGNHRALHLFALHEYAQLPFRDGERREATLPTDRKLWKHPHDGLVQTLQSGEMDGNFTDERVVIIENASFTDHRLPSHLKFQLILRVGKKVNTASTRCLVTCEQLMK